MAKELTTDSEKLTKRPAGEGEHLETDAVQNLSKKARLEVSLSVSQNESSLEAVAVQQSHLSP